MKNGIEKQDFLLKKIKEVIHKPEPPMTLKDFNKALEKDLFYETAFIESGKAKKKKEKVFENEKSFRRAIDKLVERNLLKREKRGLTYFYELL